MSSNVNPDHYIADLCMVKHLLSFAAAMSFIMGSILMFQMNAIGIASGASFVSYACMLLIASKGYYGGSKKAQSNTNRVFDRNLSIPILMVASYVVQQSIDSSYSVESFGVSPESLGYASLVRAISYAYVHGDVLHLFGVFWMVCLLSIYVRLWNRNGFLAVMTSGVLGGALIWSYSGDERFLIGSSGGMTCLIGCMVAKSINRDVGIMDKVYIVGIGVAMMIPPTLINTTAHMVHLITFTIGIVCAIISGIFNSFFRSRIIRHFDHCLFVIWIAVFLYVLLSVLVFRSK